MFPDHDPQSTIEPWIGEIDPLRPALRNGQVGDGDVDVAVGRGIDQYADRRERAVVGLKALRSCERLPKIDRHPGETCGRPSVALLATP
jgi:hypothetical protein